MKKLLLACALMPALAVNAQTVKKVMLEDFTGAWCQYCPNGSKAIEDLEASHAANFIAVASHNTGGRPASADLLAIAEGDAVATEIGATSYPTGAVDRKLLSGSKIPFGINATGDQWKSAVANRIAGGAIVSVSFANLTKTAAGAYEGDVKVKFTAAPVAGTPIAVNVYVLENKIPAEGSLKQANVTQWYGGPGGGSAIWTTTTSSGNKFYHHNTLRAAVGGTWGWTDVVPASVTVGTEYTKHFSFTIPATAVPEPWKPENLTVVAFVAYNGTAAADKKEILNAEMAKSSAFFPASVKTATSEVSFLNAYPNPASANEIVHIPYSIANSETVTLKVMNAVGQVVATPYVSEEVRGIHTIQWKPSNDGLAPGIYILQLSTPSGVQTQRLSIQ